MHEFHAIRQQLPLLAFQPERDCGDWPGFVDEYLHYYHLPRLTGRYAIGRAFPANEHIVAQYWNTENPRGTVFVLHGYFDHTGLCQHLIRFLVTAGYAVVAFDLPGHGLSGGKRAAIDSFDDYTSVFGELVKRVTSSTLPKPFHVIGQSTGAAIVMKTLFARKEHPFSGVVLLAPLVRPPQWSWRVWQYRLFRLFRLFVKGVRRPPTVSSSDPDFMSRAREQDPLRINMMTLEWIGAMKHWIDEFPRQPVVDWPVLVVQGRHDETVDWQFNIDAVAGKFPQADIHLVNQAYHNLINESPILRDHLWQLIGNYLHQRVGG